MRVAAILSRGEVLGRRFDRGKIEKQKVFFKISKSKTGDLQLIGKQAGGLGLWLLLWSHHEIPL